MYLSNNKPEEDNLPFNLATPEKWLAISVAKIIDMAYSLNNLNSAFGKFIKTLYFSCYKI